MQKPSDYELLQNLIIGRMKKQYYSELLRFKLLPQQGSLMIWQDQEIQETDLNWDPWNLWIVIYLQFIREGVVDAADSKFPSIKETDPTKITEYDLRRIKLRQHQSDFTSNPESFLAYQDHSSHLIINLELLKVHLTKQYLTKIALDSDPKWETRPGSSQFVSGAKLTEAQAKELEGQLRQKLKEMLPDIEMTHHAVGTAASNREPGVHRILIHLKSVWELCYQHIVPAVSSNSKLEGEMEFRDEEPEHQRTLRY